MRCKFQILANGLQFLILQSDLRSFEFWILVDIEYFQNNNCPFRNIEIWKCQLWSHGPQAERKLATYSMRHKKGYILHPLVRITVATVLSRYPVSWLGWSIGPRPCMHCTVQYMYPDHHDSRHSQHSRHSWQSWQLRHSGQSRHSYINHKQWTDTWLIRYCTVDVLSVVCVSTSWCHLVTVGQLHH